MTLTALLGHGVKLGRGDVLIAIRVIPGTFDDGDHLPDANIRRMKTDRMLVIGADGRQKASVPLSTWPYNDKTGRTVAMRPGFFPAAYVKGKRALAKQ